MKQPVNALVVRKVADTLLTSVFEQLLEAINILDVAYAWEVRKSPLGLIYKETGTRILFRGADNPKKIKSIKTSNYPIAILWIEELDEFKNEEEVDVIVNSVLRAELDEGSQYTIFFSYNPPKRKQSWVNRLYNSQFVSDSVFVHHSTYLDNPYVSKDFITKAEEVRELNEHRYRWIFMGEPIGGGVVPFNNLVFRSISDEELKQYDNIKPGLDWGYAADAYAYVRWHYDKLRQKIYAIDEDYGIKKSNKEAAEWIVDKRYARDTIIADSAEPKSIADVGSYGISIRGAKKGPGSVESGEKWLDELVEIVIDYNRTPNIAREFETIDYQTDRYGNVRSRLEEFDNHTIDATRYAFEEEVGKSNMGKKKSMYKGFGGAGAPEADEWQ